MKFRHEYKHRINLADKILLRTRLKTVATYDENADKDGIYTVKSLYFDNYSDKALKEKIYGVDKREKFRIRLYNDDTSYIRLEKKSKVNGLCSKESEIISEEECKKIIHGDISFLIESDKNLFRELYAKMNYQLLRPKSIVAYERETFCYPCGNVRVTIDSNIRGSVDIESFLRNDTKYYKTCPDSLLEVKYDEYLPRIIGNMVSVKNRKTSSFSKYAATR